MLSVRSIFKYYVSQEVIYFLSYIFLGVLLIHEEHRISLSDLLYDPQQARFEQLVDTQRSTAYDSPQQSLAEISRKQFLYNQEFHQLMAECFLWLISMPSALFCPRSSSSLRLSPPWCVAEYFDILFINILITITIVVKPDLECIKVCLMYSSFYRCTFLLLLLYCRLNCHDIRWCRCYHPSVRTWRHIFQWWLWWKQSLSWLLVMASQQIPISLLAYCQLSLLSIIIISHSPSYFFKDIIFYSLCHILCLPSP